MAHNDGAPSANIRVKSGLEAACDASRRQLAIYGTVMYTFTYMYT